MKQHTFPDLGVPRPVMDALAKRGITEPFPIQALVLADGMAGHDVLAKSRTGSGKTLAFALSIVERVKTDGPTPGAVDPFEAEVEDSFIREVRALAERRVPVLAGVEIDRAHCWAGLYEMSPDGHALLGWAPGCENLLLVNGSSGHGVMHAPALGALAAEMIAHGTTRSLDVRELRPSRFEEGALPGGHGLL